MDVAKLKANFNLVNFSTEEFGHLDKQNILFDRELLKEAIAIYTKVLTAQSEALTKSELTSQTKLDPSLTQLALDEMAKAQIITSKGNKFTIAGAKATLAGPELNLWKKVEPLLRQDPMKPPVLHELAKTVNLPIAATEKLLSKCIQHGLVLRPVKNRFFLTEAITELKSKAIALAKDSKDQKFTVIEFRDKVGIGRNLCIELLEYFDSTGFTRRLGDHRIIQDESR